MVLSPVTDGAPVLKNIRPHNKPVKSFFCVRGSDRFLGGKKAINCRFVFHRTAKMIKFLYTLATRRKIRSNIT